MMTTTTTTDSGHILIWKAHMSLRLSWTDKSLRRFTFRFIILCGMKILLYYFVVFDKNDFHKYLFKSKKKKNQPVSFRFFSTYKLLFHNVELHWSEENLDNNWNFKRVQMSSHYVNIWYILMIFTSGFFLFAVKVRWFVILRFSTINLKYDLVIIIKF